MPRTKQFDASIVIRVDRADRDAINAFARQRGHEPTRWMRELILAAAGIELSHAIGLAREERVAEVAEESQADVAARLEAKRIAERERVARDRAEFAAAMALAVERGEVFHG